MMYTPPSTGEKVPTRTSPDDFVYWLQGFFEVSKATKLSKEESLVIQDKLQSVFIKKTGGGIPGLMKDANGGTGLVKNGRATEVTLNSEVVTLNSSAQLNWEDSEPRFC